MTLPLKNIIYFSSASEKVSKKKCILEVEKLVEEVNGLTLEQVFKILMKKDITEDIVEKVLKRSLEEGFGTKEYIPNTAIQLVDNKDRNDNYIMDNPPQTSFSSETFFNDQGSPSDKWSDETPYHKAI